MLQPRRSIPNQPGNMQLYDAPNCDYEPPKNFQQNFGETLNHDDSDDDNDDDDDDDDDAR